MSDEDDRKLHVLHGGGKPNITKDALRNLRDGFEDAKQYVELIAGLQRAKYEALVKQGFNPDQALELSKQVF